jgi:hypothetical protein
MLGMNMNFLLWAMPALMGVALIPWINRSLSARHALIVGSLVSVVLVGLVLRSMGIWQSVPGLALAFVWLLVFAAVIFWRSRRGASNASAGSAYRPYSGAVLALLILITSAPIYSAPVRDLPKPDGPYAVGMKEFVVTDASRLGLRGEAADAPRKLLVRAYYPAENVEGLSRRPYMTPAEYDALAEAIASLGQPGFMDSYKQHIYSNTFENAPVSKDGNFPVVMFSHGFTGPMAENLFIVENMVSRGHVVFMVTHPGNTRAIVYPDGARKLIDRSVTGAMTEAIAEMMSGDAPIYNSLDEYWDADGPFQAAAAPMFSDAINIWRQDMLAITDALYAGSVDAAIAPIWRAVDEAKLAYVGFSFGGSTAGITCNEDQRCGLAITLDGNNFSPKLVNAQTRIPVVSIQGTLGSFPGTEGLLGIGIGGVNDFSFEPITQAGQSGLVTRVVVKDTKHLSFSDNASFWRGPIRPIFMVGALPADETNAAINGLIGAALDEYFDGEAGALDAFIAADGNASSYSLEGVAAWAQNRGL